MFNPRIKFEMSTITCNEVMKGNVKCINSGFEPSFEDLGADAWIRHCNATTRQQISVYSKLTFACLYPPHLEKWGYKKNFRSLRSRIMFCPLTFRIAAPPLYVGEPLEELRPHGNSKDQQGRPFMRTPAQTLQSISSRVTSQQCKSVMTIL